MRRSRTERIVVPTIGFELLYTFVIVRLDRRDLIWIDVTRHPTAEWIARQITEAFPWNEAPRYLIRDRDCIFGAIVTRRLRAMGIRDKPIAPASRFALAERFRRTVDRLNPPRELNRRDIRTKVNGRRDGRQSGGIRFGVGPLAHLLKNRFYIGEVAYRGEVHRGEHEPILTRALFEAVQEKLAANAVARQVRLRDSAALLTGRLFDDRGNRMSPTHANKKGARYRYYVSQALLQNRKAEAGSIARVPAPETENLVCDGVRRHLAAMGKEAPAILADCELIERHVARVVVKPQALDICLIPTSAASAQAENPSLTDSAPGLHPPAMIALPWTAPSFAAMKGIIHEPGTKPSFGGRPAPRFTQIVFSPGFGWLGLTECNRNIGTWSPQSS
jgi:hypothetical protein